MSGQNNEEIADFESKDNQCLLILVEQQKALLADQKAANIALLNRLDNIYKEQIDQGSKISSMNTGVVIIGLIFIISFCGGIIFAFVGF